MRAQIALLLLLVPVRGFAARFQTGQAARAVFGQSSFSAHDTGVSVTSLVASRDKLYAADASNRILTFDLSSVADVHAFPAPLSPGCAVCIAAPSASVNESVMPGVATVSVWGKSVAVVDMANHRVLLWRDSTVPRPDRGPDLILGRLNSASGSVGPSTLVNPVSVAVDGSRLFVGDAALHRVLVWNTLPLTDDQPADAVLGQSDFYASSSPEIGADTIGTPLAMASDGSNLFVADSTARRILVFSPADQSLSADAVLNSASLYPGPLAPGTLVTIRGNHLSNVTESASPEAGAPFPDSFGGVQVVFDGHALPILSVAPDEVQTQLPFDLAAHGNGALYLRVTREDGVSVSAPVALKIVPASPGIFALGGQEPRPAILLRNAAPITEENPAQGGEVLTIWATGLGAVAENAGGNQVAGRPSEESGGAVLAAVGVQIDGQAATVLSAKLQPGAVGVYAIDVVIPPPSSSNDSRMRLSIVQSGAVSNAVTFPVRSIAVAH